MQSQTGILKFVLRYSHFSLTKIRYDSSSKVSGSERAGVYFWANYFNSLLKAVSPLITSSKSARLLSAFSFLFNSPTTFQRLIYGKKKY